MIEPNRNTKRMVSRIFRFHAVGTVAEHISQAERLILRIFPGQTGTETPHEYYNYQYFTFPSATAFKWAP